MTIRSNMKSPGPMRTRFNLIDVSSCLKAVFSSLRTLAVALVSASVASMCAQTTSPSTEGPPAPGGGFFPLSQVHRGQIATAWTVFSGTKPEPMEVEILGVLRGARGPGQDMILARLRGAKPEYTGVVAGMSGSPVYIGNQLIGSLSYRIGQFAKDPIAGITPIAQMLEVKNLPIGGSLREADNGANGDSLTASAAPISASFAGIAQPTSDTQFRMMETPLIMSGFSPDAVKFWQQKMAGTGLDQVSAGGMGSGTSEADRMEPSP